MAKHDESRQRGGATPGVAQLVRAGVAHQLHEFEHDSTTVHFGREVADVLGTDPARVFKTLVVAADAQFAVAIVPADRHLSMKAVAAVLGVKRCELADQAAAERVTGYVRGGISPFGQKRRLPTMLDAAAVDFPEILVSGGRRGLEIELAPLDLVAVLEAMVVNIST